MLAVVEATSHRAKKFYGNEVAYVGWGPGAKFYHAVYFSTDSTHMTWAGTIFITFHVPRVQFRFVPLCKPSCGAS